jgi:3'-5' exoribonuclease
LTHSSELSQAPFHIDGSLSELKSMFESIVQTISNETLRHFLVEFFEDNGDFFFAPGARSDKRGHHSFKGGLAYHTLTVAELAGKISDHYNGLGMANRRDLVVAGVLLHDIGKVDSYAWVPDLEEDGDYSHTKLGMLHHHIPIGFHKVLSAVEKFNETQSSLGRPRLDKEISTQLGHIILAHHGRKSWSSPVIPSTMEAYIVHSVEMMDSYVYKYNRGDDVRSIYDN